MILHHEKSPLVLGKRAMLLRVKTKVLPRTTCPFGLSVRPKTDGTFAVPFVQGSACLAPKSCLQSANRSSRVAEG